MKKTLIILAILFLSAIFSGSLNAQDVNETNKSETKVEKQEYDKNVIIKKKPKAGTARSCSQTSAVARLRVTFDKSEKITDVEIVSSSGCRDFDESAVKAAKKIKFKPAIKNGEPITVKRTVEYIYTLYIRDAR